MARFDAPGVVADFERRLSALTPAAMRRWGKMTSHEMVCHLSDSFRGMLRERATSPAPSTALQRQLVRFIALHTPMPWPKGVPTRPEVNPHEQGTKPGEFERDRATLSDLMRRFAAADAQYAAHPMFGALSRNEWMIWAQRHVDHHFRQFGI